MSNPNRRFNALLKTYPDSRKVNAVSEAAEVLYVRLIAASDDGGNYWGDPGWVEARLFTARIQSGSTLDPPAIDRIRELVKVGLLGVYSVEGEKYLHLLDLYRPLKADRKQHLAFPLPPEGIDWGEESDLDPFPIQSGSSLDPITPTQTPTQPKPEPNGESTRGGADERPRWLVILSEEEFARIRDRDDVLGAWGDWTAYRRERQLAAWKPRTIRTQMRICLEDPGLWVASVENSICQGYQGVFPPKPGAGPAKQRTPEERAAALRLDMEEE